jgi:hypothetical protein
MIVHYIIAGGAFFGIFILFLVLSKTLNNVINHLTKLHYLLQKELDIKSEQLEIAHLLKEETDDASKKSEDK